MIKNRILIVDDNEENLSVLGNHLINNNYSVQFAENGKTALKAINHKLPDLILLDISMPDLSGFEVCKILKSDDKTKEIPIIFLTAHNETEEIVNGFTLGAVDYITKPYNKIELLSRVKTHIELKKSKDLLKKQNIELKELNATKDKFFSIISHDLRSPYNAILGFSKLAHEKLKNKNYDKLEKYCELIHDSSLQSFKLLNNLLQWSRLQTGKIDFQPILLFVKSEVNDVLELLKASYIDKNINLKISISDDIKIFADQLMLQTIIRNLISNSIKFTHEGGQITISAKIVNKNTEITVSDTGIGIEKENIDKLFRIDTEFTSKGTNKETGTGLGLILCNEFIEIHKGKIWVESEVNKGSKFIFNLPLKQ